MNSLTAVIIDSREPQWIQHLTFEVPTLVSTLDAGDFQLATSDGSLVLVERKTPEDFLNSLSSRRVFAQAARMLDLTPWAYVLITGEFRRTEDGKTATDGRLTGWNWNAVQGALLTLQELGVGIIHCSGDRDVVAAVHRLAARDREEKKIVTRTARILSEGEACLAALPGIGMERLDAVLEVHSSPAWALVGLTQLNETEHVAGIGYVTKQRIRAALGLEQDQELMILPMGVTVREVDEQGHPLPIETVMEAERV